MKILLFLLSEICMRTYDPCYMLAELMGPSHYSSSGEALTYCNYA